MRKILKLPIIIAIIGFSLFFAIAPQSAYAETASEDKLYKWALLNMMAKCYSANYMEKKVDAGTYSTFNESVLHGSAKNRKQQKFYIPTQVGNTVESDNNKVGCYEIFLGDPTGSGTFHGTMSGVFDLYGTDYEVVGTDRVGTFLKGIGYTSVSASGTSKSCITAKYTAGTPQDPYSLSGNDLGSGKICWDDELLNNPNNNIAQFSTEAIINNNGRTTSRTNPTPINIYPQYLPDGYTIGISVGGDRITNNDVYPQVTVTSGHVTIDDVKEFDGKTITFSDLDTDFVYTATLSYSNESDSSGSFSVYSIPNYNGTLLNWRQANKDARKYISNSQAAEEYHKFSDNNKYDLYTLYLSKVYHITESNAQECTETKPRRAVDGERYWLYTSQGWCRIAGSDDTDMNAKVAGFTNSERRYLNTEYDFKGLLEALFRLNQGRIDPANLDDLTQPNEDTDEGSEGCFDGAGALGWIICPILSGTAKAINFIYEQVIEPFLQINAGLFSSSNNSYGSWQIFQTFANIAFVIMLLFVIFSQLTGVGIDNYGIKKILPRLIVSAVLINLSYIICQLLVDTSNILGVSLKSLFDALASNVDISSTPVSGSATVLTGIVAVLAGGGALMATGGLGIILPLILALITTFISILFVFVLLGARQAIVVVLVVVSPLAFVCYMLPNTKKYFDKIVGLFTSMLIIFPICGLLIGGGNFASKVILAAGSGTGDSEFFFQLSAMLINIVPFFFIPSLVKSSFNAIGNIGNRVEGITRGAGARFNRGVSNSQVYKGAIARSRAGIRADGKSSRLGNVRRRLAGSNNAIGRAMQRSMAAGQTEVLKGAAEQRRARLMTDPTHIEAMAAGERAEEMRHQISDQEMLIKDMTDNDGNYIANSPEKLGDMYASSLRTLNDNPEDAEARTRVMALQNILSKTDAGRAQIQNRMEDFVDNLPEGSDTKGISAAAGHLLGEHGDTYKSKNRGFNNWISQAANGNVTKVSSHDSEGAQKYTAESLANADDEALRRIVRSYESGNMSAEDRAAISNTAGEALSNKNIQVKPEVAAYLKRIAPQGSGESDDNETPSSGNMNEGQDINIHGQSSTPSTTTTTASNQTSSTPVTTQPTPRIPSSSPDLAERVRQAEVSRDGILNIQGEGSFRQTDSGIIIPNRGSNTNANTNANANSNTNSNNAS